MTDKSNPRLTLDRPAIYQIKIPGHIDDTWLDWIGEMRMETGYAEIGFPISTLTGSLDQAALIGLLRRLYSLGMPIISVNCLEVK